MPFLLFPIDILRLGTSKPSTFHWAYIMCHILSDKVYVWYVSALECSVQELHLDVPYILRLMVLTSIVNSHELNPASNIILFFILRSARHEFASCNPQNGA